MGAMTTSSPRSAASTPLCALRHAQIIVPGDDLGVEHLVPGEHLAPVARAVTRSESLGEEAL